MLGIGLEYDFDFNMGCWLICIQVVLYLLFLFGVKSGFSGIYEVYCVWDDWVNIGQFEVDGFDGYYIEDFVLCLYDCKMQQWWVYFVNSVFGMFVVLLVGEFKGGVGIFVGMDEVDGKIVLICNVWLDIIMILCKQDWFILIDGGKIWVFIWVFIDCWGG